MSRLGPWAISPNTWVIALVGGLTGVILNLIIKEVVWVLVGKERRRKEKKAEEEVAVLRQEVAALRTLVANQEASLSAAVATSKSSAASAAASAAASSQSPAVAVAARDVAGIDPGLQIPKADSDELTAFIAARDKVRKNGDDAEASLSFLRAARALKQAVKDAEEEAAARGGEGSA
ncbi:hypothetical protein F4778DRAFT_794795 [Xylariomycetidae sp. FL2044]|nr:hypothetical protein F4778DRAFT_794795 [Xylariomycetidae sp. FL2044]